MVKIRFSNGAVVSFSGQPTEKDIEEAARRLGIQPPTQTPQAPEAEKPGFFKRAGSFIKEDLMGRKPSTEGEGVVGSMGKEIFQSTLGSRGLAGVGQMPGQVLGQAGTQKDLQQAHESRSGLADQTMELIKLARKVDDPKQKERLDEMIAENMRAMEGLQGASNELDKHTLSPRDTLSTSANAALTAVAGTGKTTAQIASRASKLAPAGSKMVPAIDKAMNVGKRMLPRSLELGALSAGFQASQNIRDENPFLQGTASAAAFGAAIPFGGAAFSKGKQAVSKSMQKTSERLINSLIKPLLKDFSFGKNPGKAVAEEGLIFNSLEQGAKVIGDRLSVIGKRINDVVRKNANKEVDISDIYNPLKKAIQEANEFPGVNASLITRLRTVQDDLLGKLKGARTITFKEAVNLKRKIGAITKFTGNASDDAVVNKALKAVYGQLKGITNKIDDRMPKLNERWSNLESARIAIKYRDKIEARQNIISVVPKLTATAFGAAGLATLNPALIISGIATIGLEKLMSSAAFKTRLASWLARSTQKERAQLLRSAPVIKPLLDKVFGESGKKQLNKADIENILKEYQPGLSIKAVSPKGKGAIPKTTDDLTSQIAKAKQSGKSFDEWATKKYANPEKQYALEEFFEKGNMLNDNGTVDLYHATTKERAIQILKEGVMKTAKDAPDSYGVYFSTSKKVAESYGDGTVIKARVKFNALQLDDAFPGSSRMDFKIETKGGVFKPEEIGYTLQPRSQLKQLWDKVK